MNRINNLLLMLTNVQAALLHNTKAYDDDLEVTWEEFKEEWEMAKNAVDKYIEKVEKD